jgi:hypothetical protein
MSLETNDWTYCNLWISTAGCDQEDLHALDTLIEELRDLDDDSPLTFFNHCEIPECLISTCGDETPEVEASNERSCGYRYLHQFTKQEWGCAFDAVEAKLGWTDDEMAFFTFRTSSNPPLGWLEKVSTLYPRLMFELEAVNELDLWDGFTVMYVNGKQVDYRHDKKQPKK